MVGILESYEIKTSLNNSFDPIEEPCGLTGLLVEVFLMEKF